MKVRTIRLVGIALVLLSMTLLALGQPTQATPKEEVKVPPQSPYKVVIFDVKHQNADAVARALVGSGAPGTSITHNRELKTITVRDYEENIRVIGEAIKRFDVAAPPPPPPSSMDFQLHLIAASQNPGEKVATPASLDKVIVQLKSTLKYTEYRFLTTLASRVINGGTVQGNGIISPPFPGPATSSPGGEKLRSQYSYQLGTVRIDDDAAGVALFQIRHFKFNLAVPLVHQSGGVSFSDVGIITELSLREGESAVVGTANVGSSDEAIIVVVTARRVK